MVLGKQIRQGATLYVLLNNSGVALTLGIEINLRTYGEIILFQLLVDGIEPYQLPQDDLLAAILVYGTPYLALGAVVQELEPLIFA